MNPLAVAAALREDYLKLLRTTSAPRQADLREAFGACEPASAEPAGQLLQPVAAEERADHDAS